MDGDVVSVERVVAAPPEAIFELVADAAKHPLIDGSGTVKEVQAGAPEKLTMGSTFGMDMKLGINYSMVSEVIEFEPNRRIAWQTKSRGFASRFTGGRIWRYELEPVDGGTKVRESWDISRDHQRRIFKLMPGMAKRTEANMSKTLDRIAEVVDKPTA
ncbi:MAG: SRPBCC family protein [Actinobacteria bacterium]|nr:SRPBCC family protein [Actinomycetota bacterium]